MRMTSLWPYTAFCAVFCVTSLTLHGFLCCIQCDVTVAYTAFCAVYGMTSLWPYTAICTVFCVTSPCPTQRSVLYSVWRHCTLHSFLFCILCDITVAYTAFCAVYGMKSLWPNAAFCPVFCVTSLLSYTSLCVHCPHVDTATPYLQMDRRHNSPTLFLSVWSYVYHLFGIRISYVFHPYVIYVRYPYVIRMPSVWHPYDLCMSYVCHRYIFCMSSGCHLYVFCMASVCHVIRVASVCHPCGIMSFVCHTYVIYLAFCHP